ncbi:dentin sialophosphoprotein-like [Liolophura sinensis]|uniref:dentin sialophosphoprotein-like n=1 Tax=Liolophura sinensis TaxID=3198878 RepID=UPI0031583A06
MKMASGDEDDDLEALRFAVLASMKPRVEDKDETSRDGGSDTEEDPELAALRAAALKTKGQNSSSNRIVQSPKFPQPIPQQNSAPIVTHHFSRGRGHGRARGRGRGLRGAGRGGMAPNTFRGGKAGSNLIVINTVPEEDPLSGTENRKQIPNSHKEISSNNVFLRPQDKWASSVSDSNSGTSSPNRSKVPNKFSRIDSSGSDDSDSESDFDELVPGEDVESDSEKEDDQLNVDISDKEGNECEDELGGEEVAGYENGQSSESESGDQTEKETEGSSDVNFQKSDNSESEEARTSNVSLNIGAGTDTNSNTEPGSERCRIVQFSHTDQSVKQQHSPEDSRAVVSPPKVQTNKVQSAENVVKPVSTGVSNVKSRLGLKPNIPKENESSEQSVCNVRHPVSEAMSPEEKQLFAARQKKFMEIMEVKDLKKTVSLKGIVPPKKPKQDARKELPKQYRHKRNRSRSNSRSPSGKVSSNHRKRERRKHKEAEAGSRVKGQRQASRDSVKLERKVRKSLSSDSDSDSDRRSASLSDSNSSDTEALTWRFKHTGKSARTERVSSGQATSVFERPRADIERERKQRQRLKRADNSRPEGRNRRNHTPERRPVRHSPSRHRRKRFVEEVSPERETRQSSVKTVVTSVVKVNSEPARSVKQAGIVKNRSRNAQVRSRSLSPRSESGSTSSSAEESGKKRDARSIIVSLRTKDGVEKEETTKDRGDAGPVKEDAENRISPVVNITFNSESSTKPKVSSRDRGSIHQRLGIPMRTKDPVDSRELDSGQRKRRRHVMEEDALDDKPLKFGIRKTDSSIRSRPVLGLAVHSSPVYTSKAKRLVRKDSDEAKEEEAVVKTNHLISVSPRDPDLPRRLSRDDKRKSEERSDSGASKKIKLKTSPENADLRSGGDTNSTKGRTPEEIQLDERIRKIHEKNQAILKRQREVIQDKKLYG